MKRPTQAAPPDAAPSGPPPPPSRVVPLALLALTLALFAVLKVYALNITIGDEHLYFHMAVLINKGLLPYRDFYFTHPPFISIPPRCCSEYGGTISIWASSCQTCPCWPGGSACSPSDGARSVPWRG